MTLTDLSPEQLAEAALDVIETTRKGYVLASRRGIVAATYVKREHRVTEAIAFRRDLKGVRMERWCWPKNANGTGHGPAKVSLHKLPESLQVRARRVLDNL